MTRALPDAITCPCLSACDYSDEQLIDFLQWLEEWRAAWQAELRLRNEAKSD